MAPWPSKFKLAGGGHGWRSARPAFGGKLTDDTLSESKSPIDEWWEGGRTWINNRGHSLLASMSGHGETTHCMSTLIHHCCSSQQAVT